MYIYIYIYIYIYVCIYTQHARSSSNSIYVYVDHSLSLSLSLSLFLSLSLSLCLYYQHQYLESTNHHFPVLRWSRRFTTTVAKPRRLIRPTPLQIALNWMPPRVSTPRPWPSSLQNKGLCMPVCFLLLIAPQQRVRRACGKPCRRTPWWRSRSRSRRKGKKPRRSTPRHRKRSTLSLFKHGCSNQCPETICCSKVPS